MNLKAVHTSNAPAAIGPYSQAIQVGNMLYTSGQTPLRPDGTLVDGSVTEQTEQVFKNLGAVLEAAGLTFNHVVKVNVYLASMEYFAEMNKVYAGIFPEHKPARTTVAVAGLPLNAKVEIEMVAVLEN